MRIFQPGRRYCLKRPKINSGAGHKLSARLREEKFSFLNFNSDIGGADLTNREAVLKTYLNEGLSEIEQKGFEFRSLAYLPQCPTLSKHMRSSDNTI
jgi:hypothetical protein